MLCSEAFQRVEAAAGSLACRVTGKTDDGYALLPTPHGEKWHQWSRFGGWKNAGTKEHALLGIIIREDNAGREWETVPVGAVESGL